MAQRREGTQVVPYEDQVWRESGQGKPCPYEGWFSARWRLRARWATGGQVAQKREGTQVVPYEDQVGREGGWGEAGKRRTGQALSLRRMGFGALEVEGEETAEEFFVAFGGAEGMVEVIPSIGGEDGLIEGVMQLSKAGGEVAGGFGDTLPIGFASAVGDEGIIEIGEGAFTQGGTIRPRAEADEVGRIQPDLAFLMQLFGGGADGGIGGGVGILLTGRPGEGEGFKGGGGVV